MAFIEYLFATRSLHRAVVLNNFEEVKELIRQGHSVNTHGLFGNTPLHLACAARPKTHLSIIKELLVHGATIFAPNCADQVPIDCTTGDEECSKLVIKLYFMKNFRGPRKMLDELEHFYRPARYIEIQQYSQDCLSELEQINKITLNEVGFVVFLSVDISRLILYMKGQNWLPNAVDTMFNLIVSSGNTYPIYSDMIIETISFLLTYLDRRTLLSKFSELQICAASYYNRPSMYRAPTIINLNSYCMYEVSKYLSNKDIINVILASCDHNTIIK